jgi:F0F1-type ATP synthase gamma subunit
MKLIIKKRMSLAARNKMKMAEKKQKNSQPYIKYFDNLF